MISLVYVQNQVTSQSTDSESSRFSNIQESEPLVDSSVYWPLNKMIVDRESTARYILSLTTMDCSKNRDFTDSLVTTMMLSESMNVPLLVLTVVASPEYNMGSSLSRMTCYVQTLSVATSNSFSSALVSPDLSLTPVIYLS